MEWVPLILGIILSIIQIYLIWNWKRCETRADKGQFQFVEKKPAKGLKRPRVRDELAGWRQEQEERYEWEQKLRERES